MNLNHIFLIIITCLFSTNASTQTIGTLLNTENAYNGYTLFIGGGDDIYLVDNCGELINWWNGFLITGSCCYLREDGSLIRAVRTNENTGFSGGGIGGGVEIRSWDDNLIWEYDYAQSQSHHQHHDIEPLPNGNVLILAWEYRTAAEALQNGKNTVGNAIWPTRIVEVEPVGANGGNIVWQWTMWDHLIQDVNTTFPNFGVVSENPQLLDINVLTNAQGNVADWLHCNSIDYIPEYDLIVISSKHSNEMYVIDHSTTIAEAATHDGGNYGKGGDILYRWGNPQNYGQGTNADKIFFGQHDVSWIPSNYLTGGGQFMAFNNNGNDANTAILEAWTPPMNLDGSFNYNAGTAYEPTQSDWRHFSDIGADTGCSTRRLPNGNTMECHSQTGEMKEFDIDHNLVWDYKNPVANTGIQTQGSTSNNPSFRAERYGPDFAGFIGKDLTPQGVIELNSTSICQIFASYSEPNAFFFANTLQSNIGLIDFSDGSAGSEIVSWAWNFGDSIGVSNEENPTYTYTLSGDYNVCLTVTDSVGAESTFCEIVSISLYVAIEDVLFNELKVYPNPAKNFLFIEQSRFENLSIELFSITGQKVISLENMQIVNLESLKPGIYNLQIKAENGILFEKIMVE